MENMTQIPSNLPVNDVLEVVQPRKQTLWDKIKRRNTSSPNIRNSLPSNWSTRSLPRLSSQTSIVSVSSSKPSITNPLDENDQTSSSIKDVVVHTSIEKDHFTPLPIEIKLHILSYLTNRQLLGASRVSSQWYQLSLDGSLYSTVIAHEFYLDITEQILEKILARGALFFRHLDLRGCSQLTTIAFGKLALKSRNIKNLSLQGCSTVETKDLAKLIKHNRNIRSLKLIGLKAVTDSVAKEIARNCPELQELNISWCHHISSSGLLEIVRKCKQLTILQATELSPFDLNVWFDILTAMHHLRHLKTLALDGSRELTDQALHYYFRGTEPIDPDDQQLPLDDSLIKPLPIRHLVLSRLPRLTDRTLRYMARATPNLRRLELVGNNQGTTFTITGTSILLPTTQFLTHLDLEDNPFIHDSTLTTIARLSMAKHLQHLCLSSCMAVSDAGLKHILQHCIRLRNLELDNTQTGNATLLEAPRWVLRRAQNGSPLSLRLVIYDCPAVTWVGISEVLLHNLQQSKAYLPSKATGSLPLIRLKCCYDMQNVVDAHYRRCLRGEFDAAHHIQAGFSRYMMEETEDGIWNRVRRRRRREHGEMSDVGRRRMRAFSSPTSSCLVM